VEAHAGLTVNASSTQHFKTFLCLHKS